MKVLKGILGVSKSYYKNLKKKLELEISKLPKGSIKKRKIGNRFYYYLQYRDNNKVIHKYLGKNNPEEIINKIEKRNSLSKELKKTIESLNLFSKMK